MSELDSEAHAATEKPYDVAYGLMSAALYSHNDIPDYCLVLELVRPSGTTVKLGVVFPEEALDKLIKCLQTTPPIN